MSVDVAVAGVVALCGIAGAIGALGYLHLAPTGLSAVRNPVSQYGISGYRGGYRVATISLGLAGAATAVGVGAAMHQRGVETVVALLAVFAVARAVISWFPMDLPSAPRTSTGQVHGLIAIVTFGSATIAALRLGHALALGQRWHSLASVSSGLGWVMLACVLALVLSRFNPGLRRYFGLVERALYVAIIGWIAMLGVACALRIA